MPGTATELSDKEVKQIRAEIAELESKKALMDAVGQRSIRAKVRNLKRKIGEYVPRETKPKTEAKAKTPVKASGLKTKATAAVAKPKRKAAA